MQQLEHVRFPEEAGISSQGVLNYIAAREASGLEPHALWVIRHGKVACRLNYDPYDDRTPHMLFSLSKSFCSTAAGFAVQEGLLHWDTKLIDVLPEAFPEDASDWLKAITMHHLLTMGSGLKPESDGGRAEPGWAKTILSYGCDHEPGTHFAYNSMSTYLVSCMVQKVTGMTVRDYLVPRLFEPLGMMKPDGTPPDWDTSPDGVNVGGWGLWLTCAQIAPFGQCLLQKGVWDGQQLLPPEWFARATVSQIDNGNGEHPHDHDWNMGYGYQFWMCKGDAPGAHRFRGDGAFGQLCIVDEKRDMVVVCTSGLGDLGKGIDLIYDHLLAAADMPPADETVQAELQAQLPTLAYPWPAHDGSDLPVGDWATESVHLHIEADQVLMTLNGVEKYLFYAGRAETGGPVRSCCGMQEGKLHLLMRFLPGPFTLRSVVTFEGDTASVTCTGVGQQERTFPLTRVNG